MKKRALVGIVIVCGGILAGSVLYAAFRPAPARAPAGAPDTVGASGAGLPALGYTEHGPYYDIAANYPTTTPLLASVGASQNAAAIALMRSFIGSTIEEFKAGGNPASSTPAAEVQGRREALQINYLISSSPRTVSYIFTVYENTLGAHENIFFHTFTFDTKTGVLLLLADLFAPHAPYLDTLSSISRARLPGIIGREYADTAFITNGTTPEDKNFANFFVDNSMLTFLFPPYQVGPYAAGPQTLSIPLSTVKDILKPEYR